MSDYDMCGCPDCQAQRAVAKASRDAAMRAAQAEEQAAIDAACYAATCAMARAIADMRRAILALAEASDELNDAHGNAPYSKAFDDATQATLNSAMLRVDDIERDMLKVLAI